MNFHIERLKEELEKRKFTNRQYSLRSFARDLRVAPSWLSEVLRGHKGMSPQKAKILVQHLRLRPREKEKFICSSQSVYSRSERVRQTSLKKWNTLSTEPETKLLSHKELRELEHWYLLAMLDLFELKDFRPSTKWMAKKLGLTDSEAKAAYNKLIELGWIEHTGHSVKPSFTEADTSFDLPDTSIAKLHKQHLALALDALKNQSVKQREFITLSMPFEKSRIAEVKDFIRDFQNEFTKKFYDKKTEKDSLYQLSIQWLRLDKET